MNKPHYIKTKDGKFAGSIGAGKTQVPVTAPDVPASVPEQHIIPESLVSAPAILEIDQIPDYCTHNYVPADSHMLPLPTKPSPEVMNQWFSPPAQEALNREVSEALDTVEELNKINDIPEDWRLVSELTKAERFMSWRAGYFQDKAEQLRDMGMHHQAYVAEWTSHIMESAYDHISTSHSRLEDPEHLDDIHPDFLYDQETTSPHDRANSLTIASTAECLRQCGSHIFNMDALRADAASITQGAVIADYLPAGSYDPEAAAVFSTLTPSLWDKLPQ